MRFTIFTTVTEGPVGGAWQETHASVETSSGTFTVELGLSNPLGTLFTDEPMLWLEIEVDQDGDGFEADEKYSPRVSLSAAPYVLSGGSFTDADVSANADVVANTAHRQAAEQVMEMYSSSHINTTGTERVHFDYTSYNTGVPFTYDGTAKEFTVTEAGYYEISMRALPQRSNGTDPLLVRGTYEYGGSQRRLFTLYDGGDKNVWTSYYGSRTLRLNAGTTVWFTATNAYLHLGSLSGEYTFLTVRRLRAN